MTDDVIRWRVSDLHPHALTLDDAPLVLGLITQQALLDNIRQLPTPPVILHLRCVAPEGHADAVLVAAGFVQVGLTKLIKIGLPVVQTDPPEGLTFAWHKAGAAADWDAWYQAHWDSYRRTHPTNITKDPGSARYPEIFGGPDLVEALFAYRDGRLVGFASLRDNQEIGWIDLADASRDGQALSAILAATLRRAAAHGWVHAELEVDDDHPALWALCAHNAFVSQQTYVIWKRSKH